MKIPPDRVAWLGAERGFRQSPQGLGPRQRFLLGECVRAYLPMDDRQRREFDELLAGESYTQVRAMNKTVYEEGIEQGEARGQRNLLRDQLQDRFGPLPPAVLTRLNDLPAERVSEVARSFWKAASLKDLGLSDD
jgi:hypothetical protein